ncbi:MAG TPA: protein kinase, partial [Gemmataceae bacterium]|nr:protein kinase [Gemmataceae bacterium]
DGTRATLMDLGLAQLADDVEGRLTRTRQFVGTLRYASPEQVLAVGRLDRRSDIYSLGATLWELLALRPLFGATEQLPTPLLMDKIQREEPARLRDLHVGLSRNLEAVVHKCLEKSPEKRYATAHELAEDLRRVQEGEPVKARPVGRVDRTLKWTRRHPAQTAAFILLACTAAALAVGFVLVNRERARTDQAYADLAATHTQLLDEQARTKEQRDTARAQKQRADDRYRQARAAMNHMLDRLNDRQLAATPRLKELYEAQLEDAITFYEGLLQEKGPLDPAVQRDVAGAFQLAGIIQAKLGLREQARKSFHRAVDLWQDLIAHSPDPLDDQAQLAVCYSGLAWVEAGNWNEKALALREQLCQARPENVAWQEALAETYHNVAAARQMAGDGAQATTFYEKALTILTTLHTRNPADPGPPTAAANNCAALGLCYMASNQPDRAEAVFRQGESLLKPLVEKSPNEPEPAIFLAGLYSNWAQLARGVQHQADVAVRLASQAVDLSERVLRQEPRFHDAQDTCLKAHGVRAYALDRPGHYEEEIRDWDRVLELSPKDERPRVRALRGWALLHAGKYAEVKATAQQLDADPKTPSRLVYEAAKLAAAAGHRAKEDPALEPSVRAVLAEENAVLAVHLLERVRQAGIFKNPFDVLTLSLDSTFDWLRKRDDFRQLQRAIAHQKPSHG